MSETITHFDLSDSITLEVYVNSSIPEGGGIIWDAARVFLHFLAKQPHGYFDYLKIDQNIQESPKIVELGAGTGVVGLAMARLHPVSKVWLTEMSEGCLKLMNKSILQNGLADRVKEMPLMWGKDEALKFKDEKMEG